MMDDLWEKVVKKGQKVEKTPISNSLNERQVMAIVSKFENERDRKQLMFDLSIPKYRLFDEFGMMLTGRVDDTKTAKEMAQKFADCLDDEDVKERHDLYDCFFQKLKVWQRSPVEFVEWDDSKEVT